MPVLTPHVPDGLIDLMKALTKSILKEKPENIYEFAVQHFEKLIAERDGSLNKGYEIFRSEEAYFQSREKYEKLILKSHYRDGALNNSLTYKIDTNDLETNNQPTLSAQRKLKARTLSSRKPSDTLISIKEEDDEEAIKIEIECEMRRRERAAFKIQKAFKGFLERLKSRGQGHMSEQAAALIIQRTLKALFTRRLKDKEAKAALLTISAGMDTRRSDIIVKPEHVNNLAEYNSDGNWSNAPQSKAPLRQNSEDQHPSIAFGERCGENETMQDMSLVESIIETKDQETEHDANEVEQRSHSIDEISDRDGDEAPVVVMSAKQESLAKIMEEARTVNEVLEANDMSVEQESLVKTLEEAESRNKVLEANVIPVKHAMPVDHESLVKIIEEARIGNEVLEANEKEGISVEQKSLIKTLEETRSRNKVLEANGIPIEKNISVEQESLAKIMENARTENKSLETNEKLEKADIAVEHESLVKVMKEVRNKNESLEKEVAQEEEETLGEVEVQTNENLGHLKRLDVTNNQESIENGINVGVSEVYNKTKEESIDSDNSSKQILDGENEIVNFTAISDATEVGTQQQTAADLVNAEIIEKINEDKPVSQSFENRTDEETLPTSESRIDSEDNPKSFNVQDEILSNSIVTQRSFGITEALKVTTLNKSIDDKHTEPSEPKSADTKTVEAKSAKSKPGEAKPEEIKSPEKTPIETNSGENKSTDHNSAEAKTAGVKSAEMKAVKTNSDDTEPLKKVQTSLSGEKEDVTQSDVGSEEQQSLMQMLKDQKKFIFEERKNAGYPETSGVTIQKDASTFGSIIAAGSDMKVSSSLETYPADEIKKPTIGNTSQTDDQIGVSDSSKSEDATKSESHSVNHAQLAASVLTLATALQGSPLVDSSLENVTDDLNKQVHTQRINSENLNQTDTIGNPNFDIHPEAFSKKTRNGTKPTDENEAAGKSIVSKPDEYREDYSEAHQSNEESNTIVENIDSTITKSSDEIVDLVSSLTAPRKQESSTDDIDTLPKDVEVDTNVIKASQYGHQLKDTFNIPNQDQISNNDHNQLDTPRFVEYITGEGTVGIVYSKVAVEINHKDNTERQANMKGDTSNSKGSTKLEQQQEHSIIESNESEMTDTTDNTENIVSLTKKDSINMDKFTKDMINETKASKVNEDIAFGTSIEDTVQKPPTSSASQHTGDVTADNVMSSSIQNLIEIPDPTPIKETSSTRTKRSVGMDQNYDTPEEKTSKMSDDQSSLVESLRDFKSKAIIPAEFVIGKELSVNVPENNREDISEIGQTENSADGKPEKEIKSHCNVINVDEEKKVKEEQNHLFCGMENLNDSFQEYIQQDNQDAEQAANTEGSSAITGTNSIDDDKVANDSSHAKPMSAEKQVDYTAEHSGIISGDGDTKENDAGNTIPSIKALQSTIGEARSIDHTGKDIELPQNAFDTVEWKPVEGDIDSIEIGEYSVDALNNVDVVSEHLSDMKIVPDLKHFDNKDDENSDANLNESSVELDEVYNISKEGDETENCDGSMDIIQSFKGVPDFKGESMVGTNAEDISNEKSEKYTQNSFENNLKVKKNQNISDHENAEIENILLSDANRHDSSSMSCETSSEAIQEATTESTNVNQLTSTHTKKKLNDFVEHINTKIYNEVSDKNSETSAIEFKSEVIKIDMNKNGEGEMETSIVKKDIIESIILVKHVSSQNMPNDSQIFEKSRQHGSPDKLISETITIQNSVPFNSGDVVETDKHYQTDQTAEDSNSIVRNAKRPSKINNESILASTSNEDLTAIRQSSHKSVKNDNKLEAIDILSTTPKLSSLQDRFTAELELYEDEFKDESTPNEDPALPIFEQLSATIASPIVEKHEELHELDPASSNEDEINRGNLETADASLTNQNMNVCYESNDVDISQPNVYSSEHVEQEEAQSFDRLLNQDFEEKIIGDEITPDAVNILSEYIVGDSVSDQIITNSVKENEAIFEKKSNYLMLFENNTDFDQNSNHPSNPSNHEIADGIDETKFEIINSPFDSNLDDESDPNIDEVEELANARTYKVVSDGKNIDILILDGTPDGDWLSGEVIFDEDAGDHNSYNNSNVDQSAEDDGEGIVENEVESLDIKESTQYNDAQERVDECNDENQTNRKKLDTDNDDNVHQNRDSAAEIHPHSDKIKRNSDDTRIPNKNTTVDSKYASEMDAVDVDQIQCTNSSLAESGLSDNKCRPANETELPEDPENFTHRDEHNEASNIDPFQHLLVQIPGDPLCDKTFETKTEVDQRADIKGSHKFDDINFANDKKTINKNILDILANRNISVLSNPTEIDKAKIEEISDTFDSLLTKKDMTSNSIDSIKNASSIVKSYAKEDEIDYNVSNAHNSELEELLSNSKENDIQHFTFKDRIPDTFEPQPKIPSDTDEFENSPHNHDLVENLNDQGYEVDSSIFTIESQSSSVQPEKLADDFDINATKEKMFNLEDSKKRDGNAADKNLTYENPSNLTIITTQSDKITENYIPKKIIDLKKDDDANIKGDDSEYTLNEGKSSLVDDENSSITKHQGQEIFEKQSYILEDTNNARPNSAQNNARKVDSTLKALDETYSNEMKGSNETTEDSSRINQATIAWEKTKTSEGSDEFQHLQRKSHSSEGENVHPTDAPGNSLPELESDITVPLSENIHGQQEKLIERLQQLRFNDAASLTNLPLDEHLSTESPENRMEFNDSEQNLEQIRNGISKMNVKNYSESDSYQQLKHDLERMNDVFKDTSQEEKSIQLFPFEDSSTENVRSLSALIEESNEEEQELDHELDSIEANTSEEISSEEIFDHPTNSKFEKLQRSENDQDEIVNTTKVSTDKTDIVETIAEQKDNVTSISLEGLPKLHFSAGMHTLEEIQNLREEGNSENGKQSIKHSSTDDLQKTSAISSSDSQEYLKTDENENLSISRESDSSEGQNDSEDKLFSISEEIINKKDIQLLTTADTSNFLVSVDKNGSDHSESRNGESVTDAESTQLSSEKDTMVKLDNTLIIPENLSANTFDNQHSAGLLFKTDVDTLNGLHKDNAIGQTDTSTIEQIENLTLPNVYDAESIEGKKKRMLENEVISTQIEYTRSLSSEEPFQEKSINKLMHVDTTVSTDYSNHGNCEIIVEKDDTENKAERFGSSKSEQGFLPLSGDSSTDFNQDTLQFDESEIKANVAFKSKEENVESEEAKLDNLREDVLSKHNNEEAIETISNHKSNNFDNFVDCLQREELHKTNPEESPLKLSQLSNSNSEAEEKLSPKRNSTDERMMIASSGYECKKEEVNRIKDTTESTDLHDSATNPSKNTESVEFSEDTTPYDSLNVLSTFQQDDVETVLGQEKENETFPGINRNIQEINDMAIVIDDGQTSFPKHGKYLHIHDEGSATNEAIISHNESKIMKPESGSILQKKSETGEHIIVHSASISKVETLEQCFDSEELEKRETQSGSKENQVSNSIESIHTESINDLQQADATRRDYLETQNRIDHCEGTSKSDETIQDSPDIIIDRKDSSEVVNTLEKPANISKTEDLIMTPSIQCGSSAKNGVSRQRATLPIESESEFEIVVNHEKLHAEYITNEQTTTSLDQIESQPQGFGAKEYENNEKHHQFSDTNEAQTSKNPLQIFNVAAETIKRAFKSYDDLKSKVFQNQDTNTNIQEHQPSAVETSNELKSGSQLKAQWYVGDEPIITTIGKNAETLSDTEEILVKDNPELDETCQDQPNKLDNAIHEDNVSLQEVETSISSIHLKDVDDQHEKVTSVDSNEYIHPSSNIDDDGILIYSERTLHSGIISSGDFLSVDSLKETSEQLELSGDNKREEEHAFTDLTQNLNEDFANLKSELVDDESKISNSLERPSLSETSNKRIKESIGSLKIDNDDSPENIPKTEHEELLQSKEASSTSEVKEDSIRDSEENNASNGLLIITTSGEDFEKHQVEHFESKVLNVDELNEIEVQNENIDDTHLHGTHEQSKLIFLQTTKEVTEDPYTEIEDGSVIEPSGREEHIEGALPEPAASVLDEDDTSNKLPEEMIPASGEQAMQQDDDTNDAGSVAPQLESTVVAEAIGKEKAQEQSPRSDVENIDISIYGEDSLEAMYYSLRKHEFLLDKMHKQASECKSASSERVQQNEGSNVELTEEIPSTVCTEEISEVQTELDKKNASAAETCQDPPELFVDIVPPSERKLSRNESYYTACLSRPITSATISPRNKGEHDSENAIELSKQKADQFIDQLHTDHSIEDISNDEIRRNILAYSISEADSDYCEPGERTNAIFNDFNISTAFEHTPSTDTDSTIVSAVTKIQAGARGFLTRRRLRRASVATTSFSDRKPSFGNDAIGESLEDLIDEEDAARRIQKSFRRYRDRRARQSAPTLSKQAVELDSSKSSSKSSEDRARQSSPTLNKQAVELDSSKSSSNSSEEAIVPIIDIKVEQKSSASSTNRESDTGTRKNNTTQDVDSSIERQSSSDNAESSASVSGDNIQESEASFDGINLAARRMTLQRGDAVQRNSTADEESSSLSGTGSSNQSAETQSTLPKLPPRAKSSGTEERRVKTLERHNNLERAKRFGTRQRTMPVQIDFEILRVLPKHLRRRIRSADQQNKPKTEF